MYKDLFTSLFRGDFISGREIEKFEETYTEMLDGQSCVATSFGIHALDIILRYYHLHEKGHLLLPVYTASVVLDLLVARNIRFTLIDIDPDRGVMSLDDFKKKFDDSVTAILHTHLLGRVADVEILNICKEKGVKVIEDCAHAHGASYNGQPVGTLGDASFFSFDYSKLVNTCTGGLLSSKDKNLIEFARNDLKIRNNPSTFNVLKSFTLGQVERLMSLRCLSFVSKKILSSTELLKRIKSIVNSLSSNRGASVLIFHRFTNFRASVGLNQLNRLDIKLNERNDKISYLKSKLKGEFKFLDEQEGDVPYYFILILEESSEHYRVELLKRGIDVGTSTAIMQDLAAKESFVGRDFALKYYLQVPIHDFISYSDLDDLAKSLLEIKTL
jgi:dTDP-4-amino-4,6-dideoxygalactose transaminase